jgi:hypothetical protein
MKAEDIPDASEVPVWKANCILIRGLLSDQPFRGEAPCNQRAVKESMCKSIFHQVRFSSHGGLFRGG